MWEPARRTIPRYRPIHSRRPLLRPLHPFLEAVLARPAVLAVHYRPVRRRIHLSLASSPRRCRFVLWLWQALWSSRSYKTYDVNISTHGCIYFFRTNFPSIAHFDIPHCWTIHRHIFPFFPHAAHEMIRCAQDFFFFASSLVNSTDLQLLLTARQSSSSLEKKEKADELGRPSKEQQIGEERSCVVVK